MGVSRDGPDARLLRRLVDRLPGMVAYWDTDLRLVIANAAYCEFMGRPVAALQGRHFSEVLGEEVFEANHPHLVAALAGERRVFERTMADGRGVTRHNEVSYSPDEVDGRVAGIFALITDITARVEAQADLDEAQEMAGVASWTLRPGDGATTWSRQLFRLVGKDPDRDVPDWAAYVELVLPEDRPIVEAVREEAERGCGFDARYRLLVDGQVRHVHTRSRVVLDAAGDPVMMRGTIQDETELRRQTQALENANRRLADLVAMVGHDVRQPLGVVVAYLDEAVEQWDVEDHERRRTYVAKALAAALRLNQMLEDILAMSKPDSDAVAVHPRRAGLAEHVAQALEQEDYPVVPRLDVRGDGEVSLDPFHLRQVLGNLLSNAARYGAPPVTVTVEACGSDVVLCVTDSGPGVPEDFVPRLFDRFARPTGEPGTGPGSAATGTGFGLYLVRELVHANGGTIDYRAAHPTGARFTITFPRAAT